MTDARTRRLVGAMFTLVAVALAWRQRFVCDDAFIAFTYARNLIEGHGLTWFGARVEGYTSFLWVLWTAIGLRAGIDPVVWSHVGGLGACAAAVWGTWRLALALFGAAAPALATTAILVTHFSFLAFATSGLETMLQTALLVHATFFALRFRREPAARDGLVLGGLLAAAVFTRPDSALPGGILAWVALRGAVARGAAGKAAGALAPADAAAARAGAVTLLCTAAIPLALWCAWKLSYYGQIPPNTYYAKTGLDPASLANGLRFLGRYCLAYGLWLPALALPFAWRRRGGRFETNLLLVMIAAWWMYVLAIGGDFMEYRMLVPLAPFLCIALVHATWTVAGAGTRRAVVAMAALGVALAGFSIHHARTFTGVTEDRCLDSVPALATFYDTYPDGDWGRIGRVLATELGASDPLIALHAVGAIPWFSRIRTLDIFGLTDAWVARHGTPAPPHFQRPGHRRQVTLEELRRRGVHFVLGHPTLVRRGVITTALATATLQDWVRMQLSYSHPPSGVVHLVAIPVNPDQALLMWYFTESSQLDELIRSRGWEGVEIMLPQ